MRIFIVGALSIIGIAAGGWLTTWPAANSDPLVGGAVITLGAMGGGALGFIGGALLGWKLPARLLRRWATVLGVPAVVLVAAGLRAAWLLDQQTQDPDEAYAGLPVFVAVLERDPLHDPNLATRVEVNARARTWTTTLPDGRQCVGRLRAEVQKRVADTLPGASVPAVCSSDAPHGASDRISWEIDDGPVGSALLDMRCRHAYPAAASLAHLVTMASGLAASSPSCD